MAESTLSLSFPNMSFAKLYQYQGTSSASVDGWKIGYAVGKLNYNIAISFTPSVNLSKVVFTLSADSATGTCYYRLKTAGSHPGISWISSGTSFSFSSKKATITLTQTFTAGTTYDLWIGTTNNNYNTCIILYNSAFACSSTIATYTITYNANNGTNAPSVGYKTYSKAYTITSDKPTRKGYIFVNWNTKQDGSGTTYLPGNSYTKDANVTLYAQWKENILTIKMNVNGGQKASDAPASMSIVNGFALDGGTHQVITYTNRNNTIYLRQYNNKSQIKLTYPGHIITKGKEFCSAPDGNGTLYDQSKGYSLADFIGANGLDSESKEIILYVNWKTGGIVHYSDGTQWIPCQVYYSDGTQWIHVIPYYSDGSEWIQCT